MKKLVRFVLVLFIALTISEQRGFAQEVTYTSANQFYYNPFESSTAATALGIFNNYNAGTTNKTVIPVATTNAAGSYALVSVNGVNTLNNVYGQIIPSSQDRNLNNNDFEWTFLYRNNSSTSPVEPYDNGQKPAPSNGNAYWQYWLTANTKDNTDVNINGFYMTQVGGSMILRYRASQNDIQSLITFNITNNVLWTIKVQRLATGRWRIWANPVSGTNYEASTYIGQQDQGAFNNYQYSILACTDLRSAGSNFYWDNFKMYTRKMTFTAVNAAANGVTQPSFYPGQTNVVVTGLQINTRGTYSFNSINIDVTSSNGTNLNAFFTNGRLYKSVDDYYNTAGDNSLLTSSVSINSPTIQSNSFTGDENYSSGNTDGSLTRVCDYYLVMDVPTSINYGNPGPYATYTYNGPSKITTSDYTNPPYAGYTNNASTGNNIISFAAASSPTVTTNAASSITQTSASLGGTVNSNGTPNVTDYGIYYTTTNTSTGSTSGTKVSMGSSITSGSSFAQTISSLSPGTTYYFWAYATNSTGTTFGSVLNFTTTSSLTVTVPVDKDATANSVPENSANGTTVGLRAYSTDSGTGYGTTNIALGKTTFTSSVNGTNVGANAVDGNSANLSPRWESTQGHDPESITIDLGAAYDIRRIKLFWENAYGKDYTIQASNDNSNWTIIKTVTGNTSTANDLTGFTNASIPYRYIKMNGTARGTTYGYSLYEFEIYSSPIVYTLSDNAGGRFAINPTTGIVTVANGTLLDYETNQSHNITVVATSGSVSASAVFTINVTDVNEAPTITSNGGGTAASISIAAGTSAVTNVTATDPDAGTVLTYSIAGGADQAKFSINSSTGALTFNTSSGLSAAGTNVYTVSVKATDNGSPALSSQTQTLTVTITGIVAPTVTAPATLCGAGTVTLTASGAAPGGGTYNWYSDATSTTPIYTSTSNTYTPFIAATSTDLYVTYTANSTTTTRAKVTVTLNPKASSSINSPMIAFPFNNGSLTDISVNGNNGTLSPNATFVVGLNTITQSPPVTTIDRNGGTNSAYSFTGSNTTPQFIYTSTNYNPPPSIFSISVWFKTTTTTGGKIVGFGGNQTTYGNATQDRNLYMTNSGQLVFGAYTLSGIVNTAPTTNAFNDGLWHHAIATIGNTNGLRIYVDGALQTPAAVAYVAPQALSGYWRIGGDSLNGWPNRPSSDYFTGAIDDLAIYNHELTATEAADNDMNLYQFSSGYCATNPLTITAQTIQNATYSWIDNDNPTATPITGQTVTFPSATTTYYKLTTTVNGCSNTAIVMPNNLTYTWSGAGLTNAITLATNWTNTSTGIAGYAPTLTLGTESIVIPSGLSKYPTLVADSKIYTLTMGTGASLGLANFMLTVGCNIINNNNSSNAISYVTANTASGITWAGTTNTSQNYYGTNTTYPLQLTKMAVNNSNTSSIVNINSGKIDVYNLLDINAGSLNIASTGTLTLKSIAMQTAAVDVIPSAYKITGNVNVERYIAGQASGTTADNTRNYRLLSSPVNVNGVTNNTTGTAFSNLAYLSATGTYNGVFTAGPNGTSAGFTFANTTPTIYLYNETLTPSSTTFNSGNFKGLTNITGNPIKLYNDAGTVAGGQNATMYSGNGFMLYYVGNNVSNTTSGSPYNKAVRANGAYIAPDASTMTAIGTLNQGNQPVKLWNATAIGLSYAKTHFCLVGNPYASAIDWNTYVSQAGITYSNVGSTIYVFDYTSKNYGAYQATTGGTTGTNNATNIIQSGQGFFVQTTGSSPSLTFTENAKSITKPNYSNPKLMGLPVVASAPLQLLRLRLAKDTINRDETMLMFQDEAKNEIEDGVDAYRINGIGNISTLASYAKDNANMLSINHMHSIDSTTRVKLFVNMTSSVGVIDTLSASGIETLDPRYDVFLIDHFKKDSLQISLYKKYNFNITTDTASYGANRFELVFHKKAGLNYRLLSFTGAKVKNTVQLTWRVENEQNLTGFNIEKPDGSKQFVSVYALQSDGKGTYTWTDQAPTIGTNSYRLRQNDPFDVISYSNTISVNFENSIFASEFMTVYPNPTVSDMNIKLNIDNVPSQVRMKIYDSTGQLKLNKITNGNNIQENIGNLLPGVYVVQIFDNATQNMIGQKKVTKAR